MAVEGSRELDLPGGTVRFTFSGHTDQGRVRRLNEDSFLAEPPLFAVADGMGGHAFGDRASQAAIRALAESRWGDAPAQPTSVLEKVKLANESVLAISTDNENGALSGTTLTGIGFVNLDQSQAGSRGNLHWMAFNIGDSRIYTWNGRTLTQLTVDHSAVQEMVDAGRLTREEAQSHPHRNVVTRALGATETVDADVWLLPARDHQMFLLCSDGLSKELRDDEIARIIVFHDSQLHREDDSPQMSLAQRLVAAAVAAGGSDNVTVVVVESELVGEVSDVGDDTLERGSLSRELEDTKPRG